MVRACLRKLRRLNPKTVVIEEARLLRLYHEWFRLQVKGILKQFEPQLPGEYAEYEACAIFFIGSVQPFT